MAAEGQAVDSKSAVGIGARMKLNRTPIFRMVFLMISLAALLSTHSISAADGQALPEFDCVIEPSEITDLALADGEPLVLGRQRLRWFGEGVGLAFLDRQPRILDTP